MVWGSCQVFPSQNRQVTWLFWLISCVCLDLTQVHVKSQLIGIKSFWSLHGPLEPYQMEIDACFVHHLHWPNHEFKPAEELWTKSCVNCDTHRAKWICELVKMPTCIHCIWIKFTFLRVFAMTTLNTIRYSWGKKLYHSCEPEPLYTMTKTDEWSDSMVQWFQRTFFSWMARVQTFCQ